MARKEATCQWEWLERGNLLVRVARKATCYWEWLGRGSLLVGVARRKILVVC